MLDEDKDGLVSFFDFITPLMSMLPAEVAAMFTQDHRFKQQTFNDLRIMFDKVATQNDGIVEADITQLRGQLEEHSRKDLLRQFENMIKLLKLEGNKTISQVDFLVGLARLEKRAMFTFVSKIYQAEERRHREPELQNEDRLVRDTVLKSAVEVALTDPELKLEHAKALLK